MPKLLLRADVKSLGHIGDLVEVNEGYARNYLIPQGLALIPTPGNLKRIADEKKHVEAKRAKEAAEKRAIANRIEGVEITIVSKANEQGHLFGSVGPKEITDALREEGYNIAIEQVELEEHIKQVDKYTVSIRFADDIKANISVWVAPEKSDDGSEAAPADDESE
jgi:large subunit ribosomal protein L9